jgi:pimeloyl-ACP methyl ester carboxylesterase
MGSPGKPLRVTGHRARAPWVGLALASLLQACAVQPSPAQRANALGFNDRIVGGDGFEHRIFSSMHPSTGLLHVYIEGDGRAWRDRRTINADPTPAEPLMLELMALDRSPRVYVGRPCYLGLANAAACAPRQWTSHRYSARTVQSMKAVIERLAGEGDYDGIVLFGHSGGGTLATLLASRIAGVRALVTMAPNLDVAAWAELHGYSPLDGSLDPARTHDFPEGIPQMHWLGGRDENIPPALALSLEPAVEGAQFRVAETFDHACCWSSIWPAQLDELQAVIQSTRTLWAQPTDEGDRQ